MFSKQQSVGNIVRFFAGFIFYPGIFRTPVGCLHILIGLVRTPVGRLHILIGLVRIPVGIILSRFCSFSVLPDMTIFCRAGFRVHPAPVRLPARSACVAGCRLHYFTVFVFDFPLCCGVVNQFSGICIPDSQFRVRFFSGRNRKEGAGFCFRRFPGADFLAGIKFSRLRQQAALRCLVGTGRLLQSVNGIVRHRALFPFIRYAAHGIADRVKALSPRKSFCR